MTQRAKYSGLSLTDADAAVVKGMLLRGDRQHDVAAWFGVNGGRVAEIATGARFDSIVAAPFEKLPPSGPYPCGREATAALKAVEAARKAVAAAEGIIRAYSKRAA